MDTPTLTVTRPSGTRIALTVDAYLGTTPRIRAEVNGTRQTESGHVRRLDAAMTVAGVTYTHATGRILLTADEATQLEAACEAIRQTPAAIQCRLRIERESLVDALRCHALADRDEQARAWERGDTLRGTDTSDSPATVAARLAVAAFDAAHPTI